MRQIIPFLLGCILVTVMSNHVFGQAAVGTTTPDPSAMYEIRSANSGFLPPRMTAAQRIGITAPANGLMVYDTDSLSYMLRSNGAWTKLMTTDADQLWKKNGNNIGNTNTGNVGINTPDPQAKLEIVDTAHTGPQAGAMLVKDRYDYMLSSATGATGAVTINTNVVNNPPSIFILHYGLVINSDSGAGAKIKSKNIGLEIESKTDGLYAYGFTSGIKGGSYSGAGGAFNSVSGSGGYFQSTTGKAIEANGHVVFWGNDNPSTTLPTPVTGTGSRFMWYAPKSAFRVGTVYPGFGSPLANPTAWDASNIGVNSFATGASTAATQANSAAFGEETHADGESSVAMGTGTMTAAYGGLVIGRYNDITNYASSDRLFQIGNGMPQGPGIARSNAMTVLSNGRVGIGTTTPTQFLDIAGAIKIGPAANPAVDGTIRYTIAGFEGYHNGNWVSLSGGGSSSGSLWTASGNDIYNGNSGNVGVGTNNPKTGLNVAGGRDVLFGNDTITGSGFWFKWNKSALRVGYNNPGSTAWADSVTGDASFSSGANNRAKGDNSAVFGSNNRVSGNQSVASGISNNIAALNSAAFGGGNRMDSLTQYTLVSGSGNTTVDADGAIVIGYNNAFAGGKGTIVVGQNDTVTSHGSAVFGNLHKDQGLYSIIAGTYNRNYGSDNAVFGHDNEANSSNLLIAGTQNTVWGTANAALGNNNYVDGQGGGGMAFGSYDTAIGYTAIAFGHDNDARNWGATAGGRYSRATDTAAVAIGTRDTASGTSSTAFGEYNKAAGKAAFASGSHSQATGFYSTAMGSDSKASGSSSFAIGDNNRAAGNVTAAIGSNNYVIAHNSVAIGNNNTIFPLANGSVAIGNANGASGNQSLAMGYSATASGLKSVAVNEGAVSTGVNAQAIGKAAIAVGDNSTSLGYITTTKSFASTALGMFNDTTDAGSATLPAPNDHLLTVGNGSLQGRSNAMTIYKNGNVRLGGANNATEAKLAVNGPIKIGNSTGYTPVAGMIRYNGTAYEGYNGTTWNTFSGSDTQKLVLSGNTLSITNGNSITLPAGGGSSYWNVSGTDIVNNNAGKVLVGAVTSSVFGEKGRLLVKDDVAFGMGVKAWTTQPYGSAIYAADSAFSGGPRFGVGGGGQEAINAYSSKGDALFAYSTGRGIFLQGGSTSYPAMVVNVNSGSGANALELNAPIKITDGTQAAGKVLTSDANGKATWQVPTVVGGSYTAGSGINITSNTISAIDNSATNEIQTLTVTGNQLAISGGNTVTLPSGGGGGQWTNLGSAVIRNTGGAQVAINTNIPLGNVPLDVRDTSGGGIIANFQSTALSSLVQIGAGGTTQGYIGAYSPTSDLYFGTNNANSAGSVNLTIQGVPRLIVASNGNTMIGNGAPQQSLDVSGGMRLGYTTTGISGSLRYDGISHKFEGHDGTSWLDLGPAGSANYWTLTGSNISANTGGKVGIGTATPLAKLHVEDSSVLYRVTYLDPSAAPPVSGTGIRNMWYAEKAAFRTGAVTFTRPTSWDRDSVGNYSIAAGIDVKAAGIASAAFGFGNSSDGTSTFTAGNSNRAKGSSSVAMGVENTVNGQANIALGQDNTTSGSQAIAIGSTNKAIGYQGAIAIGYRNKASGGFTTAVGGGGNNARSFLSTVLGVSNDSIAASDVGYWVDTDPLLMVGNGTATVPHNAMTMLKNGKTGFGTDSAQAQIDIKHNSSIVEPHLRLMEDGDDYTRLTMANTASSSFWTMAAYNSNTPGYSNLLFYNSVGGDIMTIRGDGNVGIGTTAPLAKLHVETSNVLFTGPSVLPSTPAVPSMTGSGNRMMWYADKAAFNVGGLYNRPTAWDQDSIGKWSFNAGIDNSTAGSSSIALGANNISKGNFAAALGTDNVCLENGSTAIGRQNTVTGNVSIALGTENQVAESSSLAMGNYNYASGQFATAIGKWNVTNAGGSTALGMFSDTVAGADHFYPVLTDALLTIGNGTSAAARHNAMTMLKNGNMGLGTNAPSEVLEVCGNAQVNGNVVAMGNITANQSVTCSSDERFKKDITTLPDALENVTQLRGVTYNWKQKDFPAKQFNDRLQIGVIAQEVEKIYPELVYTDKDGYKSVDYAKLTPVLIEAIKQLAAENKTLKAGNDDLNARTAAIETKLDKLEQLMTLQAAVNTAVITK